MQPTLKEFLTIGVPYWVAVGACYSMGYWGSFGINVLEFIGLTQIATLAIYPLLASVAVGVLAMLGTQMLSATYLPPGGGANSPIGRAGLKYWRLLIAMVIAAIVAVAIYGPEPSKWLVVASLVSLLSVPLGHVPRAIELLPNAFVRSFVLLLLIALPAFGFAHARIKAHLVKSGLADLYVDSQRSALPSVDDSANPVAYVGYIGGTYVLREQTSGTLLLLRAKDDKPLYLRPRER